MHLVRAVMGSACNRRAAVADQAADALDGDSPGDGPDLLGTDQLLQRRHQKRRSKKNKTEGDAQMDVSGEGAEPPECSDDEDAGTLERTTATIAIRCGEFGRDGRERLADYIRSVLSNLLESSTALEMDVVASVRTGILTLSANTPVVTRQKISEELQAADAAASAGKPLLQVFQQMLKSCLLAAKGQDVEELALPLDTRAREVPRMAAVGTKSSNVVVRNTFLDIKAPSEWDDDDGMGFRSTSDPTPWKRPITPKVVGQFGCSIPGPLQRLTSPVEEPAEGIVTPEMTPVRHTLCLAPRSEHDAGDNIDETSTDEPSIPSNVDLLVEEDETHAEEAIQHELLAENRVHAEKAWDHPFNVEAPDFIVKNTFVDGFRTQDDEDNGFGWRSSSDPTSGTLWGTSSSSAASPLRKFRPSAALEHPVVEEEDEDCLEGVDATAAEQMLLALSPEDASDRAKALSLADLVEGPDFDPEVAVNDMGGYQQGWWMSGGNTCAQYYGGYYQAYGMEAEMPAEYLADFGQGIQMAGAESSSCSSGPSASLTFGSLHSFHSEFSTMGQLRSDARQFTKQAYEGRLSVISESQVHTGGVHRYLVQFSEGELSKADGVGFIFSPRLPCKKNIQRIVSIFANQHGQICMRIFENLLRADVCVEPLKLGDWVEMVMDLDNQTVTFSIWPAAEGSTPTSRAVFSYGETLKDFYDKAQSASRRLDFRKGHLACVVKNAGVTVTLGS
mmetsp:Transcript_18/g.43  ORF Transcript_18/g.43 Transcript_18/m.43 type:complete len:730 (+) Transcript_18:45-2234(+)